MLYVALAEAAVIAAALITFTSLLRSQARANARREDLLLNQMLNLAGKPWQPAPANHRTTDADAEKRREERRRYTATPEQYPV